MSEKQKIDKPQQARINRYGFLALWIGAQALGGLFWIGIFNFFPSLLSNTWVWGLITALSMGVPTAMLQKWILNLGFGRSFNHWIRTSAVGWILGGLAISAVFELGMASNDYSLIQFLALILPAAIAQTWVLRRYLERSWLWLLASSVASSVFISIANQFNFGQMTPFLPLGLYAAVTGLTLIWLFGMQNTPQKAKSSTDSSRLEDGEVDEFDEDDLEEEVAELEETR